MAQAQFKRSIHWTQGTAMSVGSVLGSGILILPAITAEQAGPASLVSWLLMSLLAFPLALTLGLLATRIPNAGGIVAYARSAYGSRFAAVTGWMFLGTVPVGAPILALVGANYAGVVCHLSNWGMTGLAAGLLATSLFLNARGVELSARTQVVVVCLIVGLLLTAAVAATPHVHRDAFTPFLPYGWKPVGVAAVTIFWSFVGWEMVAHLAEEFRNPKRDILISLTLAPVLIGLLYMFIAIATVGTHAYGGQHELAPLSILIGKGLGPAAKDLTAFLGLMITFGGVHTNIAGFSRMVYAQAREGDFPRVFDRLHPRFRTPTRALAGLAVPFSLVLLIQGLFHLNLGQIIQWPGMIFVTLYMIAMVSALKLLPKYRAGWWLALVPLVVCAVLCPFSGWACVYPPALAAAGWFATMRTERNKRMQSSVVVKERGIPG